MNIWQVLQIEPTSDQRAIKKAYARRSREVHPEEKPEEFSRLYEAYHSALAWAKEDREPELHSETPPQPREVSFEPPPQPREASPKKTSEELCEYFQKEQKKLREKLERFQMQWRDITREYRYSKAMEDWREYLKSEDFQDIRSSSQVLETLCGEMEKLKYSHEARMSLWDAYGFEEEKRSEYHGDHLRLFEELLPGYYLDMKSERMLQERLERARRMKKIIPKGKALTVLIVAALFLLCLPASLFIYKMPTADQRFITKQMNDLYGTDTVTELKKKEMPDGEPSFYTFYSNKHPMMKVKATVYKSHDSEYELQENYGLQLLQYYGKSYGLQFGCLEGDTPVPYMDYGKPDVYVVYYSDVEDVDHVCDSLSKLFRDNRNKDLSFMNTLGICWKQAQHPELMLRWEAKKRPQSQIYQMAELGEEDAVKRSVIKGWVDYMYHYEAWNLTPEQEADYGPDYITEGRSAREEDSGSEWSPDPDIRRIEQEFNLYIPTYEKEISCDEMGIPRPLGRYSRMETYITAGNAYQLLKASGTQLNIDAGKGGFTAAGGGGIRDFDNNTDWDLDMVKEYMGGPASAFPLPMSSERLPFTDCNKGNCVL